MGDSQEPRRQDRLGARCYCVRNRASLTPHPRLSLPTQSRSQYHRILSALQTKSHKGGQRTARQINGRAFKLIGAVCAIRFREPGTCFVGRSAGRPHRSNTRVLRSEFRTLSNNDRILVQPQTSLPVSALLHGSDHRPPSTHQGLSATGLIVDWEL